MSLLEDGALILTVEPDAAALVRAWLPKLAAAEPTSHPSAATIHVTGGSLSSKLNPAGAPAVEILDMRGWIDSAAAQAVLLNRAGDLGAVIDLARCAAVIEIDGPGSVPTHERDLFCALTIAAGLLLNRQRRMLLHAGAFVAPDGRAWLLVGDSFAGKSSTCANVIRGGWDYLADDQVVVHADAGPAGIRIEGWPRAFNLDVGFHSGSSLRVRSPVEPSGLGAGRWRRSAPLGGLLFPYIREAEPTLAEPMSVADALKSVIRQSPWLLADRQAAPAVFSLMQTVASMPAYRLRLGLDSYRNPAVLTACLRPVLER